MNVKPNLFKISTLEEGQRLDNYILKTLKKLPRSLIYKLIRSGQVRVNKKRSNQLYRIKCGDIIRIPPNLTPSEIIDKKMTMDPEKYIHHENKNFILLNKPYGIAVHSGTNQKFDFLSSLKKLKDCKTLSLVHRLDMKTSGCLLIAKNYKTSSFFGKQMMEGKFTKKYLALLHGVLDKNTINVNTKIFKDTKNKKMSISKNHGKESSTIFKVIKKYNKFTLVEVDLGTGRTHQIRLHANSIGHPVLGDDKYGIKNGKNHKNHMIKRMFLHSHYISFKFDKKYEFKLDLPNDLKEVLSLLENNNE